MLQLAHRFAALIGVSETLILLASLTVAAILLFTRRLRKRAVWAHNLGRLVAFGPLALAIFIVLDGWFWNSSTIELLQRTGSLSEAQELTFWRETYFGSGKTFALGLFATSCFVLFWRNQSPRHKAAKNSHNREEVVATAEQ